ncbi:MAG: DUF4422 domain-containing protein [Selenomonadaceae bacterium]|nr:DUF4422 domain-containing protein [Selenomonadaceae bacterium]
MKINIYIATQTEHDFPQDKNYIPLIVGKPDYKLDGSMNDSTGNNISGKNPFYCELTGQYWIWKNDHTSDVVGLCHYRRFLWINDIKRRLCRKNFNALNDTVNHHLDTSSLESLLNEYDVVLPRPYIFSKDNIKSQFITYHGQKNYDLMTNSVKKLYPEYMNDLEETFSRRYEYFANLIIAKKKLFDDYSEWLFTILNNVENQIDLNDKNNARLLGYMGERLLNVYVVHNHLNIKEVPQIFISSQNDDEDLYIDFRYIKRRYFAGILDIEERIRNKLKS